VAQRVGRGTAVLFHDRGTRRGEWSAARPEPPPRQRHGTHFTRWEGNIQYTVKKYDAWVLRIGASHAILSKR